jgi:hypothetical protein
MDFKKTVSGVWHELVVHWISLGVTTLGAVAVSYWGLIAANWSWPGAVAVAIVLMAAGICAYAGIRQVRRNEQAAPTSPAPQWTPLSPKWSEPPRHIFRQHYKNESVELDGKEFVECTFVNVKFIYNGSGPVNMINCLYGLKGQPNPISMSTQNPAIYAVIALLSATKMLNGELRYDIHKAGTR